MENKMTLKNWLPLIGLTCAAFIFNTSEFIPIGLLSDIAADFSTTEARAGMIISVYAFVVMLMSLPLMILVSKIELRRLLIVITSLFVVFQMLSGMSSGYGMLMLSRIGVACTHAIFWSIVSPYAVRLVPEKMQPLALGMIATGTSIALICGMPLGRIIGLSIGWRMAFVCIGLFALALLVYMALVLPKAPSCGGFSFHKLPVLLKNPLLVGLYVLSFAVATSYYTGYSYIEPFLKQVAGMGEGMITMTMVVFGCMGIIGSISFSRFYAKNPFRFMSIVLAGVTACLFVLRPAAEQMFAVIAVCALWGAFFTASNVVMQSEVINVSPQDATSVSMSIFSGIFNLGIACGTYVGGSVCTHMSIADIGYVGGAMALLTLIFWRRFVMVRFRNALRLRHM
ncbi:MAG TPA: sugar transporter [Candidatus Alistipes excrementipullorum]|nr:sugar transporter [Candidatus Alistipes excrementipullorum]